MPKTSSNALPVLGHGFRSLDGTLLPSTPFTNTFDDPSQIISSEGSVVANFVAVDTKETLHNMLGLAGDYSKTEHSSSKIDLHEQGKLKLANEVDFDEQYLYFVIKKRVVNSQSLKSNLIIDNNVAEQLVKTAEVNNFSSVNDFYVTYGDRFVSQLDSGSEVIIVIKIDYRAKEELKNLKKSKEHKKQAVHHAIQNKLTNPDTPFDLNDDASSSSCWVHAVGAKDMRTFMPDGRNLESMIVSICDFLKTCGDEASEVPLSYHTQPYSIAVVKPSLLSLAQPSLLINQHDVTLSLQIIDQYISAVRGLYENLDNTRKRTSLFLKKYERQLEIFDAEHEDYREDKKIQKIRENYNKLNAVNQILIRMQNNIESGIIFRDEKNIEDYDTLLKNEMKSGEKAINAFTETAMIPPLLTVKHMANTATTRPFGKPKTDNEYLFIRAYEIKEGTEEKITKDIEMSKVTKNDCCACFFKPASFFWLGVSGSGYIRTSELNHKDDYVIEAQGVKEEYYVEIYALSPSKRPTLFSSTTVDLNRQAIGQSIANPNNKF